MGAQDARWAMGSKQLPLEVEDSEVGSILSSASLSRMCVQCTSAWIAKGSAAVRICCSLLLPARAPGPQEGQKEKANRDRREGRDTTGRKQRITVFARTSLSQKEVKIENACAENTQAHACTHTQGHTLILSRHLVDLVILSFTSLLSLVRIHTLHLQMQKDFFLSIIK